MAKLPSKVIGHFHLTLSDDFAARALCEGINALPAKVVDAIHAFAGSEVAPDSIKVGHLFVKTDDNHFFFKKMPSGEAVIKKLVEVDADVKKSFDAYSADERANLENNGFVLTYLRTVSSEKQGKAEEKAMVDIFLRPEYKNIITSVLEI